ncbi:hypothetical protein [Gemella cuniculi]|uniref:hypothetical protein n=1 Tax=Gemella cuniculi TaxID=150240 RepID=UPI000481379A|nr:hypothetical protein [Gemella cuniculi]
MKKLLTVLAAAGIVATLATPVASAFKDVPNDMYTQTDANGKATDAPNGADLYYNQQGLANKDENPKADPKKFPLYEQRDINGNLVSPAEATKPAAKPAEATKPAAKPAATQKAVKKALPKTSAVK